jgi:hypothetical protein
VSHARKLTIWARIPIIALITSGACAEGITPSEVPGKERQRRTRAMHPRGDGQRNRIQATSRACNRAHSLRGSFSHARTMQPGCSKLEAATKYLSVARPMWQHAKGSTPSDVTRPRSEILDYTRSHSTALLPSRPQKRSTFLLSSTTLDSGRGLSTTVKTGRSPSTTSGTGRSFSTPVGDPGRQSGPVGVPRLRNVRRSVKVDYSRL